MSTISAASHERHHRFRRILGPYQVLHGNRDLTFLFSGQAVSSIGDWLYITVLVVMAYTLTVPAAAHSQDNLVQANALMSQIDGLALLLGPGLAGLLLLGGLGRLAFVINAATYIASTLTLLQLRIAAPPPGREAGENSVSWLDETLEGWRFLRRQGRGVLMAVTMTTAGGSCFNGAIWTLAVVMAEQTWHLGSQGAGFLTGCIGVGGLVGGLGIGVVTGRLRPGQGYIWAMAGTIVSIALLGIAPAGPLPFIVIAGCGIFDVINAILGNTIIQQLTPDELLGRVFGIFEAIVVAGLLVGSLAVGLLTATIGPRATTICFALVPLVLLVAYLSGLRRLDVSIAEPCTHTAEALVGATADPA